MQDKLYIKNKNLKTEIFIKKNYIPTFIKKISQKKEKVFCIIDSKIKIHLKLKKFKNIKIISAYPDLISFRGKLFKIEISINTSLG